jgi:probable rRNA maturation factor
MYQIIVQRMVTDRTAPSTSQLKRWAKLILQEKIPNAELTIRIVDKDEMTTLNSTYRKKNKPTNVLSFPFEMPKDIDIETPILGDIVICADVIKEEAQAQQKTHDAHWAHMVVHGILHLLGYDHEKENEAEIMEAEEIVILKNMGFNNPYQEL